MVLLRTGGLSHDGLVHPVSKTRCERDVEPGVVAIGITFLFRRSNEAEVVGEVSAEPAQLGGQMYAESDDASVRGRPINPHRRWRTEARR